AISIGLLEPAKAVVLLAQCSVNSSYAIRADSFLLPLSFQLQGHSLSLLLFFGTRIGGSEPCRNPRCARSHLGRFLEVHHCFPFHASLFVGTRTPNKREPISWSQVNCLAEFFYGLVRAACEQ